ncbi:MAG TPA: ABC transporter ATP-binding protein [Candidatus Acidoferrum sp.]|nr:ABC transporter ATP-binding protein [Candidatus Acidoferrum sp.]
MSEFIFGFNVGFGPKGRQKRLVIVPVEFRRLFATVRGYRVWLALGAILMAVSAAGNAFMALMARPIFDRVLAPGQPDSGQPVPLVTFPWNNRTIYLDSFVPHMFHNAWTIFAVALLAVFIIKGLAEFCGTMLIQYVGLSAVTDLRDRVFAKLIRQPMGFFQHHPIGRLMSATINDIERLRVAMSEYLADFFLQTFSLAGFTFVLFLVNWKMALGSMIFLPFVAFPLSKLGKRIRKSVGRTQTRLGELNQMIQEGVSGNRVVKAFTMEDSEISKFRVTARRLMRENLRWISAYVLNGVMMDLLGAVIIALIVLFARDAINHHQMSTGKFMSFVIALIASYTPVKRIGIFYQQLEQARGASAQVFDYLALEEEQPDHPLAIPLPPFSRQIDFDRVKFSYDSGSAVLNDINLTVKAGEVTAIVGSSGAGKTTLVNLLPRFYSPTSGYVRIDGNNIDNVTLRSLRGQIAIVTQENILFNDTVWNNICYGRPGVPEERVVAAAQAALAHDFIQDLPQKYQTLLGDRGQRLSGGQRQRLAIARAILKDSPILILDEATSELDSESEMLVQKALANLMVGRTSFVIAHRLSTVRRADRILVLDDGEIRETGTHQELLARGGIYAHLYEMQFRDTDSPSEIPFGRRATDVQSDPQSDAPAGAD